MPSNSPFFRQPASVRGVMLKVLTALLPGIAVHVWFFGPAILVQIALASAAAIATEAAMLKLRGKPLGMFLTDGSALVTAWLLAVTFPPIGPWWLIVTATVFGLVVAKHLYGGLGQNLFNPAMVGFCLMIVAFPQLISQWPAVGATDLSAQMSAIFGERHLDAITAATPLDAMRTALHTPDSNATVASVFGAGGIFGLFGGKGWEWVAAAYALGGLWMIQQRLISWTLPGVYLATLALVSGIASLLAPASHTGPLFQLFSGGAMLGAFFIFTDPVAGSTTPRGKIITAVMAALLTWIIRSFGAYPDGIAFAALLVNLCVPLIDRYTQPPVFGHKQEGRS